jgi:hypothetical protein
MITQRRLVERVAFFLLLLASHIYPACARAGDAEVVRLIDRLVEVDEDGIGFHTSAWAVGFIAMDDEPEFAGGIIGAPRPSVSPIMRALVRKGVAALPDLINHLSDRRETRFRASAMGMWLCEEYDPKVTAARSYAAGPRQRDSLHLGRDNSVASYTLRVGDLCFVAIGQIVNRDLLAIRYQPSSCLVINSPIERPSLATRVRDDWGSLTVEQHKQSLIRDALRPAYDADPGALVRLWFYFPEDGEKLALRLLERPLYNDWLPWNFIVQRLVKEESSDRWQPLIEEFRRNHGSRYTETLPFLLRWIYWRTDAADTPPWLHDRAVAAKILARLYPEEEGKNPAFINAVGPRDQAELITAIRSFSSRRVDDAVHRIYVAMRREEFSEEQSRYDFDQLAAACVMRLIGKRYPDVILPYCKLRAQEIRYLVEEFVEERVSRLAECLPLWILGIDPDESEPENASDDPQTL